MKDAGRMLYSVEEPSAKVRLSAENNFDLIRLVAAGQVAIRHCLVHMGFAESPLTNLLSVFPGVPIFFFISGFLIFQSHSVSPSLRQFYVNRVLRIYPALIVCFLLSVVGVVCSGYLRISQLLSAQFLAWMAAQLTFVQIYNPGFMRGFGVGVLNGSVWTIAVELQFYALTPILAWLCVRRRWSWIALVACGVALNLLMLYWHEGFLAKLYSVSFPPWIYMFMLGAWLSTRPDLQRSISALSAFQVLGVFVLASTLGWALGLGILGNDVNPLSYFALILLVFKLAFTNATLSNRLLRRNDVSYGVYIYHMPVVNMMVRYGLIFQAWQVVAALATTFMLAIGSWKIIERPALRLKRVALRGY